MKKFSKNEKSKNIIIISLIVVIGILIAVDFIKSHAYFETSKTFNVLEGQVPNFAKGDVTLAVVIDGQVDKSGTFPDKKNHRYVERDDVCTNGATLEWDKTNWQAIVKTKSPTVCTLKFETIDNSLNGSEPVIKDGLVPVIISNDGTVTKTNVDDSNWYNYDESIWANAVLLTGSDNYREGEVIPEDNIESYFVWIPKYRYKLFNVEGNEIPAQEIEIEFGTSNTTDTDSSCVATNESGNIGTCSNGKWMTHPAFTSLGVNGIWVGKFETTGTTDNVTVKPNIASLRNQNISSMYNAAKSYKTGLDSHMMKNTEWGAMAYLTNSKYGRPKDENGVPTEVWINNSNAYTTGCAGDSISVEQSTTCANPYGKGGENLHGSTTDNISGIYDTIGGSWDTMMAVYNNTAGQSGLTPANIENKYIDRYTGTDVNAKILGDATGETKGWNGDLYDFYNVDLSNAWFYRGGLYSHSNGAGVFRFYIYDGSADSYYSFRIVLCPTV